MSFQILSVRQILSLGLLVILVGCGGGGGASSSSSTTNGINVPPAPGSEAKSTLTGIDVNGNGVRDEVEIALAQTYGSNKSEYSAALAFAKFQQGWLAAGAITQQQAQQTFLSEMNAAQCLRNTVSPDMARRIATDIEIQTFNTAERHTERQRLLDQAGPMELPEVGVPSC
jgi:hypothetical protein